MPADMARRGNQLAPHEMRKSMGPKQDIDLDSDDECADDNYWDKERVRVEKRVLKPAHEQMMRLSDLYDKHKVHKTERVPKAPQS